MSPQDLLYSKFRPDMYGARELGAKGRVHKAFVLHAAEIIKGGVASILDLLTNTQVTEFGPNNVACLIPAGDEAELPHYRGQLRTFRRTGRDVRSLLGFTVCFAKSVWVLNPQVVHLHSTFAGLIGRIVLISLWPFRRPKIVYCPHGWAFIMDVSPAHRRVYAVIEWVLALFTDALICISRHERATAVAYGLPGMKLHLIYNGTRPLDSTNSSAGSAYCGPPDVLKLLYIGRFDKAKGFDILIAAMKRLALYPIHLTAVGTHIESAEHPPKLPNVEYVGWLRHGQLGSYFAHADVVVVPSRWEGFGLVASEAMACGRAVVASRVCSLPELVVDETTGLLFDPEDDAGLAALLRETPRDRWVAMGQAGRERYERNFTAEICQAATAALYRRILV